MINLRIAIMANTQRARVNQGVEVSNFVSKNLPNMIAAYITIPIWNPREKKTSHDLGCFFMF